MPKCLISKGKKEWGILASVCIFMQVTYLCHSNFGAFWQPSCSRRFWPISIMFLGGGWLVSCLITLHSLCCWESSFLWFQSWIDHLVILIHISAKMSSWFWLMEIEWSWDGWSLTLLLLLHLGYKSLLQFPEVWNWSSSWRHKAIGKFCSQRLLSCIQVFFNPSFSFIFMGLHSWW